MAVAATSASRRRSSCCAVAAAVLCILMDAVCACLWEALVEMASKLVHEPGILMRVQPPSSFALPPITADEASHADLAWKSRSAAFDSTQLTIDRVKVGLWLAP